MDKKKVLVLAAKANMIRQFNYKNIKLLQKLDYEVHVATNMVEFGSMSKQENEKLKLWMQENNVISHQIDFGRGLGSFKKNILAFRQLNQLFKNEKFRFIHVHSPLGGILGRLVAKRHQIPAIYTAHGFHFFKGSSKLSWLIIYPLEWIFSFFTDTLITINNEDFELVQRKMHFKNKFLVNGIGIDVKGAKKVTDKFKSIKRKKIRKEFGIPENAFLISSVGELSDRKNHQIVLKAIKRLSESERNNIYYLIAGTGPNGELLTSIAESFNFGSNFKLAGYRNDIHDINYASDVSLLPSTREGLPVAGLDAVADGAFFMGGNVRGISDLL